MEHELLDEDSLNMLKEVMAEEFDELIELYLSDAVRHISDLQTALGACDCAAVMKIAHSLKGASSNVYAIGMSQACLALEDAARAMSETPDWKVLSRLLSEVDAVFQQTRTGFEGVVR